jgi:hypothetical protein
MKMHVYLRLVVASLPPSRYPLRGDPEAVDQDEDGAGFAIGIWCFI